MKIEPLSRCFASFVVNRLFAAFPEDALNPALEANSGRWCAF
jgi:hypothetical protein